VASAIKHVHEIAAGLWDRARLAPPAQPAIIIGSPPQHSAMNQSHIRKSKDAEQPNRH